MTNFNDRSQQSALRKHDNVTVYKIIVNDFF